ncbi:serine/threonine-protein kinase [Pseudonocardia nematodicida]|uniref:Serine/threonine-protein kinase n=1 Tax=Pseudonocardia nematodicida TaxID=1206997 RepID=A0ABV1KE05_9PSEU
MPTPPEPHDPAHVGRYRITGVLGAGGMGRVLLGEAPDGRRAAIKLVHPELVDADGFRARFRREVTLAARAPAGWTAAFLDADPDADRPWMATAYLEAPSLHDEIVHTGPMSPYRAADLGVGLASALHALHARGLVHRDLKPSNVLLTGGGPRLIDFGISRAVDGTALTATGQIIGTPEYLSPEQVTGAPRAGTAADLFALGSLLTFVVSGRTPFGGGTTAVVLSRVVHGEPDLPAELGPLEPVVRTLLDKDPARRPDAGRVAELLAGGVPGAAPAGEAATVVLPRGADPGAPPPTLVGGPPTSAAPSGPDRPRPGERWPGEPWPPDRPWHRRRWPVAAAGALVAVAAAVVVALVVGSGSGSTGTAAGPASGPASSAPPPTTAPAPTTTPAPAGDADLLAGAAVVDTSEDARFGAAADVLRFRSPSGNIACAQEPFAVRCDVLERTWEVPPVPASCAQAYGTGAQLAGAAPGSLTCVGDTIADPALPVLEFDRALRTGEVTCVSRSTGVECRNTTTGHGIAVARASYRLY